MKVTPEMQMIERDMLLHGYMGEDTRSLAAIINEDEMILKDLGVTAEDIGKAMRQITRAGMEAFDDIVEFDGYEVEVNEYKGWLGCPFKDNRKAGKRLTGVTDKATGKHMSWTDMSIHLIRDHGFFQGKGSHFRIEPAELVEFLRLTPASDEEVMGDLPQTPQDII